MVASFPGVEYGPLFDRTLENDKIDALKYSRGDYNASMEISLEARNDINWWIENVHKCMKQICHGEPNFLVRTDASSSGWGAEFDNVTTGGRWNEQELQLHINEQELLALIEKRAKEFYIDDNDVIGEDVGNGSTPNLSTMINFYPVMGENFNLGGSFGVSIPISGETRGLNFLLGPTIFLGNKSRLSLSGGVAYGTVNKLKNGLEVGDTTTITDIDSYTKSVYDFGYYFGISFSLFEIK